MPGRRKVILICFLLSVLVSLLPGCSPRIVEKVVTKVEYRDVHYRDTTIQHDSIYIREYVKGDTIHHYEYRDRYVYRDRWRDSIDVREVHDTTTVERLVEKELSIWQKTKIRLFPWVCFGFLLLLAFVFRKPLLGLFGIRI